MLHGSLARSLLSLSLLSALAGCATVQTEAAKALVSPDQEKQLGLQVKQQLEQEQHVQYLDDPVIAGYVKEITDKILPLAKKDRPDVGEWTVKVIHDPKTVNAFATPGGFLYVYSGLLLAAANTAEVAGVLGHESGHVVGRHSARQMVNQYGLEAVTEMALGKNPNSMAAMAAGLAGQTALLHYSRADEDEADQYGARYSSAAGYDPHGIATFFEKLAATEGKQPGWAALFSTHPATPDRIKKVNAYIEKNHLTGTGGHDAAKLDAVKAKIRSLPPPPPPPAKAEQSGQAGAGGK